jgi:hypothetical protein
MSLCHPSLRFALFVSAGLAACQGPTQTADTADLAAGVRLNVPFSGFTPLGSSAACVAPPATEPEYASYLPFVLPTGFTQAILSTELKDFFPVAGTGADLPDMLVLNEGGPDAGRFLYRTHEVGSNGAVTVTDLLTGITTLVDQNIGYRRLDGIAWSPWNTLLFAEETGGGRVFEWNPRTRTTATRTAVGLRPHEGIRFDSQGNLYGISETTPGSTGSGAVFKFVPDRKGDLSRGQLYALKVTDPSRTGAATWVPLDRDLVRINSDSAAILAGATGWGRPEDVEIRFGTGRGKGRDLLYVAMTAEALVIRVELNGGRAFVTDFVKEGVNVTGLNNPDNLALDLDGNIWIAEDNAPGDIWLATTGAGGVASTVARFASLSDCSAEPTGIYFDPTNEKLWVNVQHAGAPLGNDLTVEISR